jgi:hypothetical protein
LFPEYILKTLYSFEPNPLFSVAMPLPSRSGFGAKFVLLPGNQRIESCTPKTSQVRADGGSGFGADEGNLQAISGLACAEIAFFRRGEGVEVSIF